MENNLVYVIKMGDTDYYKIGLTKDINKRIAQLQTGNPLTLTVVTTFNFNNVYNSTTVSRGIEHEFHKQFEYCKCIGEWFKFSYGEVEKIIKLSQQKIANTEDWFDIFCIIREIAQETIKQVLANW